MTKPRLREAGLSTRKKKALWNRRYDADYPRWDSPLDAVTCLREGLGEMGSLLDLGCGAGRLLVALRAAGWRGSYRGVDISASAIAEASSLSDPGATWTCSSIEAFRESSQWTVVSMIECAYYIDPPRLRRAVATIHSMVRPGGFLLIRIHDFDKHARCVAVIETLAPTERIGPKLLKLSA